MTNNNNYVLYFYYALQGSMDVAFLFATANQLRHAFQLVEFKGPVIGLLIFSLVLQVTASILLLVEHMAVPKNYSARKKFVEFLSLMPFRSEFFCFFRINICIGIMMILIVVINVLTTAFGGPEKLN